MAAFCSPQRSPVLNVTLPQESSPTPGSIRGQNVLGPLAQSEIEGALGVQGLTGWAVAKEMDVSLCLT